jgi:predicted transposase/invertase (TIGR01784 family)
MIDDKDVEGCKDSERDSGEPSDAIFETRFFNPRNDVAFKKVFVQHEDLTRSFLNSTLRLTGDRQIKSVEFLPTERLPLTAESKKSILDVLCTDERGFQYIIEVQNKYMQNYVQRVQHYVSHLYSGQLERAEDYLELKPVTLLSLLNHPIFPKEVNYLSFHHNIEKETQVSYLNDMSYVFIELPKFAKKEKDLKTAEDHWIFAMKHAPEMRDIPQGAPEEVKQAYEILEKHKWTREERLAYEKAKIALMDDLDAIRTAREEGEQIGIARGREEGREEGEQIGAEKEKKNMARVMVQEGIDIQIVSKITGLSQNDIKSL